MTLVTQLFLSFQSRPNADVKVFLPYQYKNHKEPLSLPDHGTLRIGTNHPEEINVVIDAEKSYRNLWNLTKQNFLSF